MADHFAVMAGRLLTESTIQSAIDEASALPSASTMASSGSDEAVKDARPKSGVLVECRICQEEEDDTCMEAPCSCKGSLKHAHRKCVQRWCDEKGDTICEICLQQFTPNYTAPSKLFQHGRNSIFFRTPGYIQSQATQTTDQSSATSTSYGYHHNSTPKGVIYCRITAITLMLLMVLHDAISVFLGDRDACTVALITLLMLRTAGIVIPVYVILVSVTELLHRRSQQQVCGNYHSAKLSVQFYAEIQCSKRRLCAARFRRVQEQGARRSRCQFRRSNSLLSSASSRAARTREKSLV